MFRMFDEQQYLERTKTLQTRSVDDAIYLLDQNPSKYKRLSFCDCCVNDRDVIALCEALNRHPEIKALDLSSQRLTDVGAKALALTTTLTSLNVAWNHGITDQGREALRGNRYFQTLTGVTGNDGRELFERGDWKVIGFVPR